MFDLSGKVALVTGSSMGIGKAIALDLAEAGATVIINDPIGGIEAKSVFETIQNQGKKTYMAICDVSDPNQVFKMFQDLKDRFYGVDILVNNAGISIDGLVIKFGVDDWSKVLKVNLDGAFLCSKACLHYMIKKNWGRIVNITSVAGLIGLRGSPAYSASKAGLIGFTKALAREVARKGITVNCVAPGFIEGGGLFKTVRTEFLKEMMDQVPMGRVGKVEEVTSLIRFLISNGASYITGQTIMVNGGLHM